MPGAAIQNEWRLKRKDGTLVPVEVSANILDGRPLAGVRSRHQRAQSGSRISARCSCRSSTTPSDFIGIADPAGKPIYLNAAGRRMIGLAPDFPVEELQIQDCYPPEIRSFVTDVLLKTMMERGVWSGETFFRNFETHERDPGFGYPLPDSRREWRARPRHGHRHARHLGSATQRGRT